MDYCIPADLLPSSNFANRPSTEISEITFVDGIWTFMSSDTEDAPTPKCQTPTEPERFELDSAEDLDTRVMTQNDERSRVKVRRSNGQVKGVGRTHHKKAASIPQVTFAQHDRTSKLPRRNLSGRTVVPKGTKGRSLAQKQVAVNPMTGKRFFVDVHVARLVQKPPPTESPPKAPQPGRVEIQEPRCLSQTARMRKTFENLNVASLITDAADLAPALLNSSPLSMVATPRELYAEAQWQPKRQSDPCPRLDRSRSPGLGRSESSSTVSRIVQEAHQALGESVHTTGVEQIDIAAKRRVYLPGNICLESCSEKGRRDSVASLDPFQVTMEVQREKFFDLVGLDDIGMYFEDLGVIEETSDKCLDRYWLEERREIGTNVREPTVTGMHSPHSAPFPYSSELSNASPPWSWTAKRQRIKLRKLLSPGFPGSVFGKSLHSENRA